MGVGARADALEPRSCRVAVAWIDIDGADRRRVGCYTGGCIACHSVALS